MFPYSYLSILINANHCLSVHLSVTLNTKTILDVQTFKIHQMKRIEKTNLTIVVIWLYVHMFHSKSRKTGSKYSNRNKSMTHETEKPQS